MSRRAPDALALADDAWLLRYDADGRGEIDDAVNARVHADAARLRAAAPAWLRDLVPAYASLAVFFDTAAIDAAQVRDWLLTCLQADDDADARVAVAREIEIPVVYGGEYGPDLDSAAAELDLAPHILAERHAAGRYTVAMIGFAPGFPYLSGLDPALALPRLATPRTQVAPGSVAIGGVQTGIYPRASPGGWRVLGRTPLTLFDPQRDPPTALLPGDRVRFVAIDAAQFARIAQVAPA